MRRLRGVVALALMLSVAFGTVANAKGVEWCEDDPIVTVEGREFHLVTGFPRAALSSLLGPVRYVVEVPSNATVTVVYPKAEVESQVEIVKTLRTWSGGADNTLKVKVTVIIEATTKFQFVTTVSGPAIKEPFSESGKSNEPERFGVNLRSRP